MATVVTENRETITNQRKTGKKGAVIVLALLILVFSLKFIGINRPLIGNYSSYQTPAATVARNLARDNFSSLFFQEYDIIYQGSQAIRMLDFPVYDVTAALLFKMTPFSMDVCSRLQAVLFMLLSSVVLFLTARRMFNIRVAVISVFVLNLSPLGFIYGQSMHNEASALFFAITSIYFILGYKRTGKSGYFLGSALFFSMSLVTRVNCIYLFVPIGCLLLEEANIKAIKKSFIYFLLAGILPLAWYSFTYYQDKTNINVINSLFLQLAVRNEFPNPIFFDLGFYGRILSYVVNMCFNPAGFTILIVSLVLFIKKENTWLYLWLISTLVLILLIPKKFYDHDFYFLHCVPPGAVMIGLFLDKLTGLMPSVRKRAGLYLSLGIISLVFLARFGFWQAFTVPEIEKNVVEISENVRRHVPEDSWIITGFPHETLLYYCDRKGFVMDLSENRKLSQWQKVKEFSHLTDTEIKRKEKLIQDSVAYLEYLRDEGVAYFVSPKNYLKEKDRRLLDYMNSNFKQISEENDNLYIFYLGEANG